jgi:hypothetical protein
METTASIPTEAEIDAQWQECMRRVGDMGLHASFVIDDYPGGTIRVKCRMSIEYRPNMGFRTVKETTNKFGNWCKPKRGVYQDHPIVVVTGDFGKRSVAWLKMDAMTGPYIQFANGDTEALCKPPLWRRTQREPEKFWAAVKGVHHEHVIEADPPALCDAWERWWEHYQRLANTLLAFAVQATREE